MDPAWRIESHSSKNEGSTNLYVYHSITLSFDIVSCTWIAPGHHVPASTGSTVRFLQGPSVLAGIAGSFHTPGVPRVKPPASTGSFFLLKGKTCWGRLGHPGVAPGSGSQGRLLLVSLRFRPRSTTLTPRSRACSVLLDALEACSGSKEGTRSGKRQVHSREKAAEHPGALFWAGKEAQPCRGTVRAVNQPTWNENTDERVVS